MVLEKQFGIYLEENRVKVCKMGLESIWINHADGSVRMCGWTNYNIGKLVESSIEELWNGEKAQEFRKSLLDGSYRYCNSNKCPYCANNSKEELMVEYHVPDYPKYCSLSYEQSCNYICKFCRTEKYIPAKSEKNNLIIIERELNKFIGKVDVLSANGVGELFCSPSIIRTLSSLPDDNNIKIELESNGSLFNEKNWNKISNLGNHNLTVYITVHSFCEKTYQYLSGTNLPVSNIIDNLHFISKLRKRGIINHFEIATVVCERNFREMPDYIKYCLQKFDPDKIRLRFFEPYGVRGKLVEWFYDIRNPYHPYYDEFVDVMKDPIFLDQKVWKWQGEMLSEQREYPLLTEKKKLQLLSRLIIMENIKEKILEYSKKNEIDRFAIYGNGYVGQAFASLLELNKVNFGCIFDSYVEKSFDFKGHEVVRPCEENIKDYNMIIIASEWYNDIEIILLKLKFKGKIISLDKLANDLNSCI